MQMLKEDLCYNLSMVESGYQCSTSFLIFEANINKDKSDFSRPQAIIDAEFEEMKVEFDVFQYQSVGEWAKWLMSWKRKKKVDYETGMLTHGLVWEV